MDGSENAEVRSKTSFMTRSAKNSPLDRAEDAEVGGNWDGSNNKMAKRSPFFKISSGSISVSYLLTL